MLGIKTQEWRCPTCRYALPQFVRVCPECGSVLELRRVLPQRIVFGGRAVSLLLLITLVSMSALVAIVVMVDGRRIIQSQNISQREADIETAMYKATSWARDMGLPENKTAPLFSPRSVSPSPLWDGVESVLNNQPVVTYVVTVAGILGLLASIGVLALGHDSKMLQCKRLQLHAVILTSVTCMIISVLLWVQPFLR